MIRVDVGLVSLDVVSPERNRMFAVFTPVDEEGLRALTSERSELLEDKLMAIGEAVVAWYSRPAEVGECDAQVKLFVEHLESLIAPAGLSDVITIHVTEDIDAAELRAGSLSQIIEMLQSARAAKANEPQSGEAESAAPALGENDPFLRVVMYSNASGFYMDQAFHKGLEGLHERSIRENLRELHKRIHGVKSFQKVLAAFVETMDDVESHALPKTLEEGEALHGRRSGLIRGLIGFSGTLGFYQHILIEDLGYDTPESRAYAAAQGGGADGSEAAASAAASILAALLGRPLADVHVIAVPQNP
ncbi:hypothetical protein EBT31_06510 [bacterium]|nr:hypothetical protein [bacterium]